MGLNFAFLFELKRDCLNKFRGPVTDFLLHVLGVLIPEGLSPHTLDRLVLSGNFD